MTHLEAILKHYPNAKDCVQGHVGYPVVTEEYEQDDDRAWVIKVERCSHCNMVLGAE